MDLSVKYIKMCSQAIELQNLKIMSYGFSHQEGNFFYDRSKKESFSVGDINTSNGTNDEFTSDYHSEDCIWLPRQDQLQEIFKMSTYNLILEFNRFYGSFCEMYGKDEFIYREYSMEQLWLMFVMKEKYGKVWDNRTEVIVNPNGDNEELEGNGWNWYYE